MEQARLKQLYKSTICPELKESLSISNVMEVPKLSKIVLNVGVKEATADSKIMQEIVDVISAITGQKAVKTLARKSIAGFKLREGMPIGVKVTLRRNAMYEFLDRLINLALPKTRDFQGVSTKFDRQGNYNLGIKEWSIFPEIEAETALKLHGLNITIETTTDNDEYARELLTRFGMPFRKS